MIPGQNILADAASVITLQTVDYYQYTGRTVNSVGQQETTYATAIEIEGSFQPVPKKLYEKYGLDLQSSYFSFFTSVDALDVNREVSGDQIAFNGRRYQCESNTAWHAIDGWVEILCVDIGADS